MLTSGPSPRGSDSNDLQVQPASPSDSNVQPRGGGEDTTTVLERSLGGGGR